MPNLEEIKKIVISACNEFKVNRLDLFGSVALGNNSADSDIDLLVEFENPEQQLSKRFFGLLHHLEDRLECKIDLLTIDGIKNPYFRRRVLEEKVNIYEK